MADFGKRSTTLEILDVEEPPESLVNQNYLEMMRVNQWLGGYLPLKKALKSLFETRPDQRSWYIVDVGCGIGDVLGKLNKWFPQYELKLTGIDPNPIAHKLATERFEGIEFVRCNYQDWQTKESPDIVVSSLFGHHLNDKQLVEFIKWQKNQAKVGFVFNDLHRHWFGYYSIKWIAYALFTTYLFKNDAPLSVLRGFKKEDLSQFTDENTTLQWEWAFRWNLVGYSGR